VHLFSFALLRSFSSLTNRCHERCYYLATKHVTVYYINFLSVDYFLYLLLCAIKNFIIIISTNVSMSSMMRGISTVRSACHHRSYATFIQAIEWMTKIYHLLRSAEGTLSCWSLLRLHSLQPTPISRRVNVKRPVVKIITEPL
jgi:hypothetical protein